MRFMSAVLLLAVSSCCLVHGIDWSRVRHRFKTVPDTGYRKTGARIIGGNQATQHQFPYQVGIFTTYEDGVGFCGGSLISETTVLTAAHCTDGGSKFEVHLGAQNIRNEREPDHIVEVTRNFVQHEHYNKVTMSNDIAVLKLHRSVLGYPGVEKVRLPSRSQVGKTFTDEMALVSGWGRTSDGTDQISKELRYVNVTVITNRECKNSFGPIITSSKLCTDSLNANGNEGTCNGDSGGPLIITEPSDGEPTLIGVVSFGAESCEAGVPSAYTRVTSHLDWIANNDAATLHTTGVLFCMSLLLHAILTRQ